MRSQHTQSMVRQQRGGRLGGPVSKHKRMLMTVLAGVVISALCGIGPATVLAKTPDAVCNGVVNAAGCQSYQRIPVFPLNGAALNVGYVDDILFTRPGRYAFEKYRLVGGRPNTTYHVQL